MKKLLTILAMTISLNTFANVTNCKQITIVNSVPPGGLHDQSSRDVAKLVTERTGIPTVVDAKPAGAQALFYVKQQKPDGCTIGHFRSTFFINQAIEGKDKVDYDIMNDFVHVGILMKYSSLIVAGPKVPEVKTYNDFIALTKNRPVNISSSGAIQDIIFNDFIAHYKPKDSVIVRYKGMAPQLLDLIGGHHDIGFTAIAANALQYIDEGKLVPLAVTGEIRLPSLPKVPTLKELGWNYVDYAYSPFTLPAGASPEVVKFWSDIIRDIWAVPGVAAKWQSYGVDSFDANPVTSKVFLQRALDKAATKKIGN